MKSTKHSRSGSNSPTRHPHHKKKHKNSTYQCNGCQVFHPSQYAVLQHKQLSRQSLCRDDVVSCEFCGRCFWNETGLSMHQSTNQDCKRAKLRDDNISCLEFDLGNSESQSSMSSVTINASRSDDDGRAYNDDSSHIEANDSNVLHKNLPSGIDVHQEVNDVLPIGIDNHHSLLSGVEVQKHLKKITRQYPAEHLRSKEAQANLFLLQCRNDKRDLCLDLKQVRSTRLLSNMDMIIAEGFDRTAFVDPNKYGDIKTLISHYRNADAEREDTDESCEDISNQQLVMFLQVHAKVVVDSEDDYSDIDEVKQSLCEYDSSMNISNDDDEEVHRREIQESCNSQHQIEQTNRVGIRQNDNMVFVHGTIDKSIRIMQEEVDEVRDTIAFDNTDYAHMQLYELLRTSGAPKYLFEKIQRWAKDHVEDIKTSRPILRKTFVSNMGDKMFGKNVSMQMKPMMKKVILPSGSDIDVVVFSLKGALVSLLSNKELMKEECLLLHKDDPFKIPRKSDVVGELNSGWWHRETASSVCIEEDRDILLPIVIFLDGNQIDTNGKLNIEPFTITLGIFNRATRNLPQAWRTIGFLENLNHKECEVG